MKIKDFMVDIFPISSADVIEVKSLEQECSLSPWSIDDYYAEVDRVDSIALVAKVKDNVVGFILARPIITADSMNPCEIEIYNICVASKFRKNGIGKSLICGLDKATSRKITSMWLEVRESNIEAVAFYSNLGFKRISTRKRFYHSPTEDGLIMRRIFD